MIRLFNKYSRFSLAVTVLLALIAPVFPAGAEHLPAKTDPWQYQGDIALGNLVDESYRVPTLLEYDELKFALIGGVTSTYDDNGHRSSTPSNMVIFFDHLPRSCDQYNIRTAFLPEGLTYPSAFTINGEIYVFGGIDHWGISTGVHPYVYRYDEASNTFVIDSSESYRYDSAQYFFANGAVHRFVPDYHDFLPDRFVQLAEPFLQVYVPGKGWVNKPVNPEALSLLDEYYYSTPVADNDKVYILADHLIIYNFSNDRIQHTDLELDKNYSGPNFVDDGALHLFYGKDEPATFTGSPPFSISQQVDVINLETLKFVDSDHLYSFVQPVFNISNGYALGVDDMFENEYPYSIYRFNDTSDSLYPEQQKAINEISKVYWEVLYRRPDPAGLGYWAEMYRQGMLLDDIEQNFLNSPERGLIVTRRNIRNLYLDVLQREPDSDGWTYWVDRFNEGMRLDQIGATFRQSQEYKGA